MSTTFDQGREAVARLCEYFAVNQQALLASGVKEAHLRQVLIDPFFEALGWDVHNAAGVAPQYREVIPEDSVEVEGRPGAPDYAFRVGPLTKFFAEAKKCDLNLAEAPVPAFQLRSYGWSAKVPLSLLTNFEELCVSDCTMKPDQKDAASHARIMYLRYEEYVERWRELWDVFSREAVWSGAFDRFATSKRKRGTTAVDKAFLADLERWREVLARTLALRNPDLSVDDLKAAVQRTIDRVVFLRMAEDRGLEPFERLLTLCDRPDIYSRFMRNLCDSADRKYNSGLFHFRVEGGSADAPDRITPTLTVDDKVFKPILQGLYFAHGCPYNFKAMPVEILGSAYERFLGKVIRLTAGHQAKVEEKPEVRKAGGVYYTPAYIVEYIVKNTVGRQVEGRSPAQLAGTKGTSPFRVLDMACGSGSFLLGAYQYLLDHCLQWYAEHQPGRHKSAVYNGRGGTWRLTIEEKKRILTTHIFGVDIDPQAVEVAKLSLLLAVLEGENERTFATQSERKLFERALPNLADNIKCGNALVGPGYFLREQVPDPAELRRINPLDWSTSFPEAARVGGFDCVIGNPPWGQKDIVKDPRLTAYLRDQYPSLRSGIFDLFRPFVEAAVLRTRIGGTWGYVLPDIILLKEYPTTRAFLLEHVAFSAMAHWGQAFEDAVIDAVSLIGRRETDDRVRRQSRLEITIRDREGETVRRQLRQITFHRANEFTFNLFADRNTVKLVAKLDAWPTFAAFCEPHEGVHSGNVREKLFLDQRKNRFCVPMIFGRDEVQRYHLEWHGKYLNRAPGVVDRGKGEYANVGRPEWYGQPKIIIRRTGDRLVCALDADGYYFSNNVFVSPPRAGIAVDLRYLLGLLNSRLMTWYYLAIQPRQGRVFAEIKIKHIQKFPIRPIDVQRAEEKAAHDRMVQLVDAMLALHRQHAAAKSVAQREVLQRQRDAADREIDRLVYDLYELTADEIGMVLGRDR